jgi:hypothetical protein
MKTVDIVVENGQAVERVVALPFVGQPVLIMTSHERPVEGRVELARGNTVEISVGVLPRDAERLWGRGLFIEYAIEAGVYRIRTLLTDIARRDGAYRVAMQTVDRSALLLTRQHVRAPLALPIRVQGNEGLQRTVTVDIGGGGLRLPFEIGATVGDDLRLELDNVPPHSLIVATARVVREAPEGGLGVVFTDIGDSERAAIMGLAFAHRRARMRLDLP